MFHNESQLSKYYKWVSRLKLLTFHYPLETVILTILEPILPVYLLFCAVLLEESKEDKGKRFSYSLSLFHSRFLVSFEMKPQFQVEPPKGF